MNDWPVSELIPHSGKMLLLDRVVAYGEDWLQAEVDVTSDSMFVIDGHLDAIVVIEYMAQAVAALAGIRAKKNHEPVRIGLLLGTRNYSCDADKIAINSTIEVEVKEMFLEENGLGVFTCKASAGDMHMACQLNVYHPKDMREFENG